jgi:hypothetical protein
VCSCFDRKKKSPSSSEGFFFLFFGEQREISFYERRLERERSFFLPIKIPLKTLNSTRKVSGFEHPP